MSKVLPLFAVFIVSLNVNLIQAAPYDHWPNDVKIFLTEKQANHILDKPMQQLLPAKVHTFFVDENERLVKEINGSIPMQKLKGMSESQRKEWLIENAVPQVERSIIPIMRSKAGVSFMRMYEMTKLPAILIDNYYVSYGVPVSEAILRWQIKADSRQRKP